MTRPHLLAALLLAACEAPTPQQAADEPAPDRPEAPVVEDPPLYTGDPSLAAVPDVAERAVKAVVNIATTTVRRVREPRGPYWFDPFFRDFLGPDGLPRMPREEREASLGSGVIVREDGTILTNHHVVGGADRIEVTLHDGRTFRGVVVGTDPPSDVAVIRLENAPADLPVLPFGDSSKLRLGQSVLAIGNPFGIGQTVTMGIVSATGRANLGIVDYEDFVQTDAAINPGNSGGALVDLHGRLVGINTAIASRSGGYQGIGFAIPSNMARAILEDILEDGRVDRGFLGVGVQDLDADLARALGLSLTEGVVVTGITPGSPAERAGLRRGDVIVAFDGRAVRDGTALRMAVAAARPGSPFTVEVVRGGERLRFEGRLARLDTEGAQAGPGALPGGPAGGGEVTPRGPR